MMIWLGIDNGLDGAIAAVLDTEFATAWPTPVIADGGKQRYNDDAMLQLLERIIKDCVVGMVAIESAQARPKQGVSSSFSIGLGFGIWRGLVAGRQLPRTIVRPQEWQKRLLTGIEGSDTKAKSILAAQRAYPTLTLRRTEKSHTDHDGMADAVNLARYARILYYEQRGETT